MKVSKMDGRGKCSTLTVSGDAKLQIFFQALRSVRLIRGNHGRNDDEIGPGDSGLARRSQTWTPVQRRMQGACMRCASGIVTRSREVFACCIRPTSRLTHVGSTGSRRRSSLARRIAPPLALAPGPAAATPLCSPHTGMQTAGTPRRVSTMQEPHCDH